MNKFPIKRLILLNVVVRGLIITSLGLFITLLGSFDESAILISSPLNDNLLPFLRWDIFYFLQIAIRGYTAENEMAFLPGLPAILHCSGWVISTLRGNGLIEVQDLVLGGLVTTGLVGILANIALYNLTLNLFKNRQFAILISILFLFPPSPVTLNATLYTEPFAAFFTFSGMNEFVKKRWWRASFFWCWGSGFRAQGIILGIGFFGWEFLLGAWRGGRVDFRKLVFGIPKFIFFSTISAASFLVYQYWGYQKFCGQVEMEMRRPWCDQGFGFSYGFIQSEYWNVGLFRYWTLAQIPNFLLAAPVLAASFAASYTYYSHNYINVLATTFPFLFTPTNPKLPNPNRPFLSPSLTPFIHLHTALTLLLFFASHVQIILRVSATNPILFWFIGDLIISKNAWGKSWIKYCVIYGSVSVMLWAGFYPPA